MAGLASVGSWTINRYSNYSMPEQVFEIRLNTEQVFEIRLNTEQVWAMSRYTGYSDEDNEKLSRQRLHRYSG